MNIDWKKRLSNKTWWVSMIGAVLLLSQQIGVYDLGNIIPKNYADIINTVFVILSMLGISVDTSTKGIADKSDK